MCVHNNKTFKDQMLIGVGRPVRSPLSHGGQKDFYDEMTHV